jgi:hypothetical protein
MLNKLNREGIKFDSRKKKFFSSKRKPISEKLKSENEHLATSVQKFNKGQYLQNELLMNTIMKNNKSGIGYNAFVQKKATT